MNKRLIRPALSALVAGAVIAGGAVYGSPALAEEPTPAATDVESPSPSPSESESESPSPSPSEPEADPESPSPSPSVSESVSAEPSVTSPSPTPSQTPDKDVQGPDKADFRLNYTSVWLGQKVTFSQTAADLHDPTDETSALKRIVSWGDGTTTTLAASTTAATKTYGRKGSFKVTVTVTDPAGNRLVTAAKTVGVTVATGTVAVSRKTLYQGQPLTVTIKKAPAGATYFYVDYTDGWPWYDKVKNGISLTTRVLYRYRWDEASGEYVQVGTGKISGKRALKIYWYNAKGWSVSQPISTVNFLKDSVKPTLTVTKPSATNKASSWRTIRGTVSDKHSGVRHLGVTIVRATSTGKLYCLTQANKWKRFTSNTVRDKYCYNNGVEPKIVKGKWSLKIPAGISRNQKIWIDVWAYDWSQNRRQRHRVAVITRN